MNELHDHVEAVRRNVPMYIGSLELFGFIHYLVCPVALMLAHGAKEIHANLDNGFELYSDAVIRIEQTDSGKIVPFQEFRPVDPGHNFEAVVLNALSQELYVSVHTGLRREALRFSRGVLVSHVSMETPEGPRFSR
jgi:hypothetical protein